MSRAQEIDTKIKALREERKTAKDEDAKREAATTGKLLSLLASKTIKAVMAQRGKDAVVTLKADGGDPTIKASSGGGTKAPSRSRRVGVTDWVVDGKHLGSPMASRLIAAIYNVEAPKDLYEPDSPERFLDRPKTVEDAVKHEVYAVVGGKQIPFAKFVESHPAS